MPSSHLILCRPLLLLPPIPPSIRVFSNESALRIRWPRYWSFSFSIIPSKEIPGLIQFKKKIYFNNKSRRLQKDFAGYYVFLPIPSLQNNTRWVWSSWKITFMWFYYWFLFVVPAISGCAVLIPNFWPISWICNFRHKWSAWDMTERVNLLIHLHFS